MSDDSGSEDELELEDTDIGLSNEGNDAEDGMGELNFKPMAGSNNIEDLRAKLRRRMEELRRKKGPKRDSESGAGDKDELLEERRRQRAAMRERRRKETKEKKRREEEERGKKTKGKEKQTVTGPTTKVRVFILQLSIVAAYI